MRHPLGLGCLTRESALASIWFAKNAPHRIINGGGGGKSRVGGSCPKYPPPQISPVFPRFASVSPRFSPFPPVFPRFPPFFPATGNQTPTGCGNLGPLLLGMAGGHRWQESVSQPTEGLNRRQLMANRQQLLTGWRSPEVQTYQMPAVFFFLP